MALNLRLGLRDWDYITPLVIGDVTSDRLTVDVDRVGTLIGDLASDEGHDVAEMSFSRYAQRRHAGDESIIGIPNFIMRGFRHRCIITRKDSQMHSLSDLKGKKIGLTGWQDSGNTWTRAAVRQAGVQIEDCQWYAGRLTEKHPITDRIGRFGKPGLIEACPDERPMVDLLEEGFLDAVFTPFMPEGFFEKSSPFRQLLDDFRAAEVSYLNEVGYIPGMHIIGIKTAIADANPWVMDELSQLIDASKAMWMEKRHKYAETTPWMFDEMRRCVIDLTDDWDVSGIEANRKMVEDFASELSAQKILDRHMSVEELFPRFA